MTQKPDQCLGEWIDREALAEAMIPLIGQLYRNNNVVTSIFGRGLINRSVISTLKAHRFARHRLANDAELSVHDTFPIIKAMSELKLGAASVDLGKMAAKFKAEGAGRSLEQFLREELAEVVGQQNGVARKGTDVVLYGFGRIGRLLARILIEKTGGGDGLRLRAIVVRKGAENDLAKRASLLRRDSVHGPFNGTIVIDEENNTITAIEERTPPEHIPGLYPRWVAQFGVTDVIAGGMGQKAIDLFNEQCINAFVGGPMKSAQEIVLDFLSDKLVLQANYCNHDGDHEHGGCGNH